MRKMTWTLFSIIVLLGFTAGCVEEDPVETYGSEYTIYFSNTAMTGHVPVSVDLEESTEEKTIEAMLRILKEGLADSEFLTTIPENVRVLNVSVSNQEAIIDFSKEYAEMDSPITEIICRSSVVKSITGLEGIDRVAFKVEGIPLKDSEGNVIGAMNEQDIIMDIKDETSGGEEMTLRVYFADPTGAYLVAEDRVVQIDATMGYEETILSLLIEGPMEENHYPTLPAETRVKDIYTRDGICYVDLNEAFITAHLGGSAGETMTIFSIVNSLAERPNISKVQFLVEGEIKEAFKGHFEFDVTFEPDWDLVMKE